MRSLLSVRRPHTTQHATNARRSRGQAVKRARQQLLNWQHSAVLIDPIAEKRRAVFAALALNQALHAEKEVSEEEILQKAEKNRKKKIALEEARKAEKERKQAEREQKRQADEAAQKKKEEEEYAQWKEQQRLKEEAENQRQLEEKARDAEQKQKAQKESLKQQAKKDKKKSESEKAVVQDVKVETAVPVAPSAASAPAEEKSEKKNKKNKKMSESEPAPVPVVEAPVVEEIVQKVEAPVEAEAAPEKSSKKNKKDKKKSESEHVPAQIVEAPAVEEIVEKVEAPAAAEAAPEKSSKKNKKDKKKSESEAVAEPIAEPIPAPVVEAAPAAPLAPAYSKVDDDMDFLDFVSKKPAAVAEEQTAPAEVVAEPVAESAKPEPTEEHHAETHTDKKKKNKKNKKHSESEKSSEVTEHAAPVESSTADVHEELAEKIVVAEVSAPVVDAVPAAVKAPAYSQAVDSMDFLDFVSSKPALEAEAEVTPAEVAAKPTAEPAKPAPVYSTIEDDLDFLDFVGSKPKAAEETTPEASNDKAETAAHVEEDVVQKVIVHEESSNKAPSDNKKKNKKNKNKSGDSTNAEIVVESAAPVPEPSEIVIEPATTAAPEASPAPVVETSTETHDDHSTASKNKKKNKKKSGKSVSEDSEPVIEAAHVPECEIVSEPVVDTQANGVHKDEIELNYGDPATVKKTEVVANGGTHESESKSSKKKNKKNKNSKSISEEQTTIPEIITELHVNKQGLDSLVDDEVAALNAGTASPPIQVNEVTSSESNENGVKTTTETITVSAPIDEKDASPTRFAENVQKLVQQTLKQHDMVEIDPSVKMQIDAQLIKLAERKPIVLMETRNVITPLPIQLHISRPSTPVNRERLYKLLPKDILFCSGLIESHGDNYQAMAADGRNVYKENARGLQRKIRIFKESPHFQTYLRAKEEGVSVESLLSQEN